MYILMSAKDQTNISAAAPEILSEGCLCSMDTGKVGRQAQHNRCYEYITNPWVVCVYSGPKYRI